VTGPVGIAAASALDAARYDAMRVEFRTFTVFEGGAFVERPRWVWVCPCHDRVSGPWLDRPTLANAWAEHAELLGGAS
jgi:hypothetical protein